MSGLVGIMALGIVSAVLRVRPLASRTRAGSETLCPKAKSDDGCLIWWATACLTGEAYLRSGSDSLLDCGLAELHSTRGLYPSNLTGRDGFRLAA